MFWHLSSLNTTKMFEEIFSLYEMCHKSILDLSELFPATDNIKLAGNLSLSINNNNLWKKNKQFSLDIWSHHKCWYAQQGAFSRCINLLYARMSWLHSEAEIRVVNISIDLLAVRSWCHPVLTSGYILGLSGNYATSSANANAVENYHVFFKNVFYVGLFCENLAFPKNLCTP